MTSYKAKAELPEREWIEIELETDAAGAIKQVNLKAVGCHEIIEVADRVKGSVIGKKLEAVHWSGTSHGDLLVAEIFTKFQNKFECPIKDSELCHCRKIPTQVVDNAIILGAHTPEKVRAWTSASSGCGTCRPDVEKLIQFRLKNSQTS